MRVHPSIIILTLFSTPFVVASDKKHLAASKVREALLDLPSFLSTVTQDIAPFEETDDPDALEQSWLHRALQFTEAYLATYQELWQDQALNDAYAVYSAGIDEAVGGLSISGCSEGNGGTNFTCDFGQPINGETEFKNACANAGGEIRPFSLDLSCTASIDGQATNLAIDLPTMMECLPASADFPCCTDEVRDLIQNVTDVYDTVAEGLFTAQGLQDVSCTVGDLAGGSNGGNSSSGGSTGGGDNNSTGGGDNGGDGSSKASSVGHLLGFVVMAFAALTLG